MERRGPSIDYELLREDTEVYPGWYYESRINLESLKMEFVNARSICAYGDFLDACCNGFLFAV